MTRMYLSPSATAGAKVGLILIECLIGLFNLISFPIRKLTFKFFTFAFSVSSAIYSFQHHADIKVHLAAFLITAFGAAVAVFVVKLIHKILNKKISPKIAFMINSPFGIPLNRYHISAGHAC